MEAMPVWYSTSGANALIVLEEHVAAEAIAILSRSKERHEAGMQIICDLGVAPSDRTGSELLGTLTGGSFACAR